MKLKLDDHDIGTKNSDGKYKHVIWAESMDSLGAKAGKTLMEESKMAMLLANSGRNLARLIREKDFDKWDAMIRFIKTLSDNRLADIKDFVTLTDNAANYRSNNNNTQSKVLGVTSTNIGPNNNNNQTHLHIKPYMNNNSYMKPYMNNNNQGQTYTQLDTDPF